MKMDAAFNEWLRAKLDQTSDEHWPLILRRQEHLAIQGSVRSAEFILNARTLTRPTTAGVSEDANPSSYYTINILVPRPPPLPMEEDIDLVVATSDGPVSVTSPAGLCLRDNFTTREIAPAVHGPGHRRVDERSNR
jgi:hypothetical protein